MCNLQYYPPTIRKGLHGMEIKAILWGDEYSINFFMPYLKKEIRKGCLKIVATVVQKGGKLLVQGPSVHFHEIPYDYVILAAKRSSGWYAPYYEAYVSAKNQGIPTEKLVDGRIFLTHGFDFLRFCDMGIVYGDISAEDIRDASFADAERMYQGDGFIVSLGRKSSMGNAKVLGIGEIRIGNFTSFSDNIVFELGLNNGHDYHRGFTYDLGNLDWEWANIFCPPRIKGDIYVGSDVWIGIGTTFKALKPEKPLHIGNGAVVASDSVVVNDVPPFAIVGGNPARIIKYRFPQEIIDGFEKIRWWDWEMERLHDAFPLLERN